MKLWLDDRRPAPDGWEWCKTVRDVKPYLAIIAEAIEVLSLDHDLGERQTGYDLVKWMEENNHWPAGDIMLHTSNPVGRENMARAIDASGLYEYSADGRTFLRKDPDEQE